MNLLLEDVIDLFLVHLFLLAAGEADASGELLHLALAALRDGLARQVPEASDHLPASEPEQVLLPAAQIDQLLLDVLL